MKQQQVAVKTNASASFAPPANKQQRATGTEGQIRTDVFKSPAAPPKKLAVDLMVSDRVSKVPAGDKVSTKTTPYSFHTPDSANSVSSGPKQPTNKRVVAKQSDT